MGSNLKHKFNAKPCELDNIKFSSQKERKRYQELKILKSAGEVIFFLMQVPFHLPGKVKYICDFIVFWDNGDITIEDTKGVKTPQYITKKKIVESLYPIKILEI